MRQPITRLLWHAVLAVSAILAGACGGQLPGEVLGVPFRTQESETYCAAACVQMWQAYNLPGTPETPQSVIFQYMGGQTANCGNVAAAANVYALAGCVCSEEVAGGAGDFEDNWRRAVTKQATSVYSGQPVIALVNSWLHAVIVDGGGSHIEDQYAIWDYVYINNPALFYPDAYITPSEWKTAIGANQGLIRHVVSSFATANWADYLATYGGSVYESGGDSGPDNQM